MNASIIDDMRYLSEHASTQAARADWLRLLQQVAEQLIGAGL